MKLYNFSYSSKVGLVFFANSPNKKEIFSFEKEFFFYINLNNIETLKKKNTKNFFFPWRTSIFLWYLNQLRIFSKDWCNSLLMSSILSWDTNTVICRKKIIFIWKKMIDYWPFHRTLSNKKGPSFGRSYRFELVPF